MSGSLTGSVVPKVNSGEHRFSSPDASEFRASTPVADARFAERGWESGRDAVREPNGLPDFDTCMLGMWGGQLGPNVVSNTSSTTVALSAVVLVSVVSPPLSTKISAPPSTLKVSLGIDGNLLLFPPVSAASKPSP
jgi:hypothetical protein